MVDHTKGLNTLYSKCMYDNIHVHVVAFYMCQKYFNMQFRRRILWGEGGIYMYLKCNIYGRRGCPDLEEQVSTCGGRSWGASDNEGGWEIPEHLLVEMKALMWRSK